MLDWAMPGSYQVDIMGVDAERPDPPEGLAVRSGSAVETGPLQFAADRPGQPGLALSRSILPRGDG